MGNVLEQGNNVEKELMSQINGSVEKKEVIKEDSDITKTGKELQKEFSPSILGRYVLTISDQLNKLADGKSGVNAPDKMKADSKKVAIQLEKIAQRLKKIG